ncbi:MAG: RNA 2',3'-cyclic phosphodiesterase [Calditrichaeota bacterium]|nr:RNA 2',3'-cyclic phosphodiesterase [Calditrichota bacterium]
MEKIRTFIAIKISPELMQHCAALIDELKTLPAAVKWVKPETIHLTLKFLGNITRDQLEQVQQVVESVVRGEGAFELESAELGAFPSLDRPRVFWVGLAGNGQQQLMALQKKLESALAQIGFPEEARPFKPHLTLGRVKSSRQLTQVIGKIKSTAFPNIAFPVKEVLIMRSELRPDGARYSVLKSFPLQERASQ